MRWSSASLRLSPSDGISVTLGGCAEGDATSMARACVETEAPPQPERPRASAKTETEAAALRRSASAAFRIREILMLIVLSRRQRTSAAPLTRADDDFSGWLGAVVPDAYPLRPKPGIAEQHP